MPAVEPRFYPKERRFYCESRQLMSKSDRLSFRSRAKSLVSKTPRLVFTIITELPAHAIMFEEMSVYLGIDYNLEHSTTEDLPPVLLREVRIGYLDQVELGFRQQMYSTERVTTIQSPPARKSVHCVFKKDQMVPITERMALRQILPPGRLVTDELSFETPNIRRYYHDLFITVTVVCAGEEFVASSRTEGRKFSFLPPALPPKGTELLASMVQPVEVPNGERYETESQAPLRELQGESLQELESRVPLVELPAGSPAR
ncbi:hypothetical protein MMC20_005881 [Loxospora ochrophaea]|nr:hypothetical protein [Loxospora ochrophaea]